MPCTQTFIKISCTLKWGQFYKGTFLTEKKYRVSFSCKYNSFYPSTREKLHIDVLIMSGREKQNIVMLKRFLILNERDWLLIFSLQFHPWIKYWGHENKANDHQLGKLLTVNQTLRVSTSGNIKRTVWRVCILMFGCAGLNTPKKLWCNLTPLRPEP